MQTLLRSLVFRSSGLIVTGVLACFAGVLLFERWISSIIADYSIGVGSAASAALAIGTTALLATYLPARGAVGLDPARVLRAE